MTLTNKILLTVYFIIWTVCLVLTYAYLTDRFDIYGRYFGPIIWLFTFLVSVVTIISIALLYCFKTKTRKLNLKLLKLTIMPAFGLVPFFAINSIPRQLDDTIHKISVTYVAYGCECASWKIISDNGTKCKDSDCDDIFLEPINEKINLPDTIGYNGDVIELTGKFYSKKGFPKDYRTEQTHEKARVFQFSDYKVISSQYELYKDAAE